MLQVGRLAEFPKGCLVAQFLGKGYDDAIKNANDWAIQQNTKLIFYYQQLLVTKFHSILVCYQRGDENELS